MCGEGNISYKGKIGEFRENKVDLYMADGSKKILSTYSFKSIEEIPNLKITLPKKKLARRKKAAEYEKAVEDDEAKEKEKAMNEDIEEDEDVGELEEKVSDE